MRRDAHHLQVRTSPGTVIDDRPGLRSFLRLLNRVRAGVSAVGELTANDEAEWLPVLDVNVVGMARMSAAALLLIFASPASVRS